MYSIKNILLNSIVGVFRIVIFMALIFSGGCEKEPDITDEVPPDIDSSVYLPDAQGNIGVINATGQWIVIKKGEVILKYLPDDATEFRICVPNSTGNEVDLRAYLVDEDGNISEEIYRRNYAILSATCDDSHRIIWVIGEDSNVEEIAKLTLEYSGGTDISVNAFLNFHNGPKFALRPGDKRTIYLDYGDYTLHYLYYSNPGNAEFIDTLGWVDYELKMGEEVLIYVILNPSRSNCYRIIPHWTGGLPSDAQWGDILILNDTPIPVKIFVNSVESGYVLIENTIYTDGDIENESTIESGDTRRYTVPAFIDDFEAVHLGTGAVVDYFTGSIIPNSQIEWVVDTIPGK